MKPHRTRNAIAAAMLATVAVASDVGDERVRGLVIRESLAGYQGSCPCPYNADRAGRACGARSAWSRGGGVKPICYTREVTDQQVRRFRSRHQI